MNLSVCPTTDRWQAFLTGGVSHGEQLLVESHLSRCRPCRERLIDLYDEGQELRIEQAPAQVKERVAASSPDIPHLFTAGWRQTALPIAAVLVLAVGAATFVYWQRQTVEQQRPGEILRQSDKVSEVLRGLAPANETPATDKLDFRWTELPQAIRYDVTVLGESGETLIRRPSEAVGLTVNPAQAGLSFDRVYYWTVAARLPDGRSIESEPVRFMLKR
jgi:hypothetical protein